MYRRRFLCAVGALSALSGCGTVEYALGGGSDPDYPSRSAHAEALIHEKVNEQREANGLPPLERNEQLDEVAQYHSDDMAEHGYLGHESPDGTRRGGYCAENVGRVGDEVGEPETFVGYLIAGWMGSERHRANILARGWRGTGIGVARGEGWMYATQDFC